MRPPRSVSVLMPTYQGMEFLDRVLDALAAQEIALEWDFHAIDSGSSDGTWELLHERRESFPVPMRLERIHKVEFDHGDTRNLLAARSRGDLLVFLTQDAIPSSPRWLVTLVNNFHDPRVAAATCRNVARPDADPLTRIFSAGDPGYADRRRETRLPEPEVYAELSPDERRLLYNFNDVASAVRRELWERHPFPRTSFGEDVLMARAMLEAGHTVVHDDEATVEHSHDYDAAETYARAWIDGRFNREWLGRTCVASPQDARALGRRFESDDRAAIAALGYGERTNEQLAQRAAELRGAAFLGLHDGGADAERCHPETRALESEHLRVLYVVHGFPPDTWAGTEIYTYNIASEMQRRGHQCTVLTRTPAPSDDAEDFSIEASEFQGLRVLRLVNRLAYRNLSETYVQPQVEEAFRRVLHDERPDLVHFQHLIHTSVGLVDIAKSFGLATVITCHDYWALCARVQLIRPGGERCEGNRGSGCFLCVKEKQLAHIERAHAHDTNCGELVEAFALHVERSNAWGWLKNRVLDYRFVRERERLVPAAYAACDLQISPSRFLRDRYLASGAFDPQRFLFSDNGMRTDHVEALEKRPDRAGSIRFGFVGSLVWYKGGEVMVRAMARLTGERCVLNVYGTWDPENDPHHAELAELATDNVEFRGRFDNARLSDVYAEIDVLVVPSIWFENSPITIHEAFLTNTPVLASDIGGMAEFVRDGVDGLHFKTGDDADLAAKMLRFIREEDLLECLSRNFPPVKTLAENGEEMEFRYRALAAIVREVKPRVLLERAGNEDTRREGPVDAQGADMLLIRPGGGAVEYDLLGIPGGSVEIAVDVFGLADEPTTEMGGRVLVDGEEVGRLPLWRSEGRDEVRTFTIQAELEAGARRLRVESAIEAGGPEACLRVKRVAVSELAEVFA
ncbi:MAG: glycosyltransferase [bacterium]|nr:glycosyltransferase [bacterium]